MQRPLGIGPHEGHELELMLTGEKKAALFADFLQDDGSIAENIIPEDAFSSFVVSDRLKRFCVDTFYPELKRTFRLVIFTQPGEEWRADTLIWLQNFKDENADIMTGRLLGYSDSDIQKFLGHRRLSTST